MPARAASRGIQADRARAASTAPTRPSSRGAAPSTSASRSPPSPSCSRPGPTSCAAGSASSATSWSTSSRTPTSPRSSSSSCSAGRPTGPTTSWSSATTTSRSTASAAPASPPSPSSTRGSRGRPPTTRTAAPPGPPPRLRIEQNFRSVGNVLTAANRLIASNETRFEPDKRLRDRSRGRRPGRARRLRRRRRTRRSRSSTPSRRLAGEGTGRRWTDVAVLYRKHKHREAIVARLRDEDIPYTVVGGLSPVRDAGDPRPRAGAAGDRRPARRRRARPDDDRRPVAARRARDPARHAGRRSSIERTCSRPSRRSSTSGQVEVDVGRRAARGRDAEPRARSTPRRARARSCASSSGALDELNPLTWREGPLTILERYLERTGPGPRPDRRRHARVEADGRQHRELHALRGGLAGGATRAGRWPGSSTTSTRTRRPAASCRRASSCPRTSTASG